LASEIRSAEQALTQAGGVQVDVQVLVTEATVGEEVEKTDAALADTIEKELRANLQSQELVSSDFTVGNPFIVTAVVTTDLDPTSEAFLSEVEAAEDALAEVLGLPVRLTVTVEPSGSPLDSPTETPAPTTVPTPIPTSVPTVAPLPTEVPPSTEAPLATTAPAQTEAPPPTVEPVTTTAPQPTATLEPATEVTPTGAGAP
jgi:hypothetical protein